MSEQLPLWEEPPDDLPDIEDPPEARCNTCGVVLGDPTLVTIGYCSSECEREYRDN